MTTATVNSDVEQATVLHVPCASLGSTLLSGAFALSALLTGLLINYAPLPLERRDMTQLNAKTVSYCNVTLLPPARVYSNDTLLMPNQHHDHWTVLMPILLPIVYICIKDWTITINKFKKQILYHHLMGQTMSFSSSEVIRHWLVYPNLYFFTQCNLTDTACQSLFSLAPPPIEHHFSNNNNTTTTTNSNVSTFPLCPNSTVPNKDIYNNLHSIPNLNLALLGSASMFILFHLKSSSSWTTTTPNPWNKWCPYGAQYKMCNQHLLKNLCLIVFIVFLYIYVSQTVNMYMNSWPDVIGSFLYGVIVQLAILKTKKK